MDLRSPWPPFLDWLDSDPERALVAFYDFGRRVLQTWPPPCLVALGERREEAIAQVLFRCVDQEFRRLRTYKNRGNAFAGWLAVVANNLAKDMLKELPPEPPSEPKPKREHETVEPPDAFAIELVRRCIEQLGPKCRLLIEVWTRWAITGQELAEALGWLSNPEAAREAGWEGSSDPAQDREWVARAGAKASNDLRYCKGVLRQKLLDAGYDPEAER